MNRAGNAPIGAMLDTNHTATVAELYFRVQLWIDAHPCAVLKDSAERLAAHFNVSISTAYRWLSAYRAARGEA